MARARCTVRTVRQVVCSGAVSCGEVGTSQAAAGVQLVLQQQASGALTNFRSPGGRLWQLHVSFAARPLSGAAGGEQAAAGGGGARQRPQGQQAASAAEQQGLVQAEEEFSAITDKIPQRPVTMVEGTSYTLLIVGALGFAGAVIYAAVNELFLSPKEYVCYNQTVERLREDPRVAVRLGTPVSAYGTESRNRASRQRIPHRVYNDSEGREHLQLQFHLRGPSGRATVNADMYKDGSSWKYHFLYMDVEAPVPQQVVFVRPGQVDDS